MIDEKVEVMFWNRKDERLEFCGVEVFYFNSFREADEFSKNAKSSIKGLHAITMECGVVSYTNFVHGKVFPLSYSIGISGLTLRKKEIINKAECKKRLEHFAYVAMMEDIDDMFPYGGKVK